MTTPRRRILRTSPVTAAPRTSRKTARIIAKLDQERATLARWTSRLKRAFHAFERQQAVIARIEKRLTRNSD